MIATNGDIIKTKSCIFRKNGLDSSLTVVIASVEVVNHQIIPALELGFSILGLRYCVAFLHLAPVKTVNH